MFQFRKVQLILQSQYEKLRQTQFQFRKVQLILISYYLPRFARFVSIPQGPINTLSSIQQSPL